jgi:ABC-type Fe3+ transport system permease subunit
MLRIVTAAYLVYLATPIVLLFAGSLGELWLDTLLPTGVTLQWYREVAADPSFQRAFRASLVVAGATCAACVLLGLPLACAILREGRGVRSLARVLYRLPVAPSHPRGADRGGDAVFPAAAALASMIIASCSVMLGGGEWFASRHERYLQP